MARIPCRLMHLLCMNIHICIYIYTYIILYVVIIITLIVRHFANIIDIKMMETTGIIMHNSNKKGS